jgi:hypothetical protein
MRGGGAPSKERLLASPNFILTSFWIAIKSSCNILFRNLRKRCILQIQLNNSDKKSVKPSGNSSVLFVEVTTSRLISIAMHNIRNIAIISLCLFLVISCATAKNDCPLVGKWSSSEKATFEQMEKYGNLTEEQRNIFLNIFGKLTIEYTCSTVTSYHKDSLVAREMKYEIIKRVGNLFEIKYHAPELLGRVTSRRITLVGDCYYLPVERFTFTEVFCRVE